MESGWTDDIENVLDKLRQNSANMAEYHRRQYFSLHHSLNYFKIPIIVISAINSVLSVMLGKFMIQDAVSVLTSILALITGIIGSTELFLRINDRMEIELASSKNYYLLQADIFKMLNLSRSNRHDDPHTFLNNSFEEYRKLFTASNIKRKYVKDYIIDIEQDYSKLSSVDVDSVNIDILPSRKPSIET